MDALTLCVTGWVGRDGEQSTDHHGRTVYKFPLACNFELGEGHEKSTLWLNCTVLNPNVLEQCNERGIAKGERILITSTYCDLNAVLKENRARAFLNVLCTQVIFLSDAKAAPVTRLLPERVESGHIIEFEKLVNRAG